MRTAFHDAVARFGGPGTRSERALSSRRVGVARATSDTPVALRTIALTIKKTRSPSSQDRLTSHRVNGTELPRPRVPSPFASRRRSAVGAA